MANLYPFGPHNEKVRPGAFYEPHRDTVQRWARTEEVLKNGIMRGGGCCGEENVLRGGKWSSAADMEALLNNPLVVKGAKEFVHLKDAVMRRVKNAREKGKYARRKRKGAGLNLAGRGLNLAGHYGRGRSADWDRTVRDEFANACQQIHDNITEQSGAGAEDITDLVRSSACSNKKDIPKMVKYLLPTVTAHQTGHGITRATANKIGRHLRSLANDLWSGKEGALAREGLARMGYRMKGGKLNFKKVLGAFGKARGNKHLRRGVNNIVGSKVNRSGAWKAAGNVLDGLGL